MRNFILTILLSSLITSFLILLLSLIFNLLKTKISPKAQYWIWILLFIGLLIPFRPTFGSGLVKINSANTALQITSETAPAVSSSKPDLWTSILGLPWLNLLLVIWLGGLLFHIVKHVLAYHKYQQMISRWGREVEELHILEHFFEIKERLGIKNEISLIHYPPGHSPMMTGFRNLKVLLPDLDYTDEELDLIFEHELTHYLHRDIYVNLLGIIVTSLYWFNPIVRFGYKEIQEASEIYCDYDVLQQRDNSYRTFYGETIITMIDQSQKRPIALTTCFYSNKFNLKRRIIAIMTNTVPKRLLSAALLVVIPLSLLLTGSIFAFTSQQQTVPYAYKQESSSLSREEALAKALKAANLKSEQVQEFSIKETKDYYELTFQTKTEQFTSQVSLKNGQIIRLEKKALGHTQEATTASEKASPAVDTSPEAASTQVGATYTPAPSPTPASESQSKAVPVPSVVVSSDDDDDDDSDDDDDDDDDDD